MREWQAKTIGDLVTLQRGIDLPDAKRIPGSVPIMGSFGITGRHNEAACKGPGVTVGRSGASAGVVCYIEDDFWPLNTCLYVRDFKGNHPRFAYYMLKTFDLASLNSGSAQPSLNRNFVHPVPATFPEPPEQAAIAAVLGALDDKIELNQRMNETLEATARALFKDWFIDFGPTRAKIEGREPYLSSDIMRLFPDRLAGPGTPQGWVSSTIGEEVEVVGGATPSTKDPHFWGGDIAWATPKDLSSLATPVLLSTERKISAAGLSQIGSGLLPTGTVLLSSRAPIGYVAIAQIPIAINQGFIAMICNKRLSNIFIWLWTHANMDVVIQHANGSTFQEISKANFRPIAINVASPEILLAFDGIVRPLFDQIVANDEENLILAESRDFLLPKLISGTVRVKAATKVVRGAK